MDEETILHKRNELVRERLLSVQNEIGSLYKKIVEVCQRERVAGQKYIDILPEITENQLKTECDTLLKHVQAHPMYSKVESAQVLSSVQKNILDQQNELNFHFFSTAIKWESSPKPVVRRTPSVDRKASVDQSKSGPMKKKFPRFKPLPKSVFKRQVRKDLYGFEFHAWQLKVSSRPLCEYLVSAKKAVLTKDWQCAREEAKQLKLYQKIDALKKEKAWCFRQLVPFQEPERPKSQWDHFLDEMRWMHTDFRQEKKFKIALAYHLVHEVKFWHDSEDKGSLQIKVKPPNLLTDYQLQEIEAKRASVETMGVEEFSIMDIDLDLTHTSPYTKNPSFISVAYGIEVYDQVNCSTFQDCPVYESFPEDYPNYINPIGDIIPVSKFMSQNMYLHMSEIKPEDHDDEDVPRIHVGVPKIASIFTSHENSVATQTLKLLAPIKEAGDREGIDWSSKEEEHLKYLWLAYGPNWDLISDILNSFKKSRETKRTSYSCFLHFCKIHRKENNESDEISIARDEVKVSKGTTFCRGAVEDKSQNLKKYCTTFDFIKKCGKRRESQKNQPQPMPKKINLTAHETHVQSQVQAGVNPNGPILNSLDLSRIKDRRDKEMRQAHGHPLAGFPLNRVHFMNRPGFPFQQPFRPMARPPTPGSNYPPAPQTPSNSHTQHNAPNTPNNQTPQNTNTDAQSTPASVSTPTPQQQAAAAAVAAHHQHTLHMQTPTPRPPANAAQAAAAVALAAAAASQAANTSMNANQAMAAAAAQQRMAFAAGMPTQMTPEQLKAAMARNMLARGMPFPAGQFPIPMDPSAFQLNPAAAQRLQHQFAQQQAAVMAAAGLNMAGHPATPNAAQQNLNLINKITQQQQQQQQQNQSQAQPPQTPTPQSQQQQQQQTPQQTPKQ